MTIVHTTLVPVPMPSTTDSDEWCHKLNNLNQAYCGAKLPADEPFCGEFVRAHVGTCDACGRPYCPDCVAACRY